VISYNKMLNHLILVNLKPLAPLAEAAGAAGARSLPRKARAAFCAADEVFLKRGLTGLFERPIHRIRNTG
jgi:hypothetical protein